jgi:hypothetical protein
MREPDYHGLVAIVVATCAAVGIFIITPLALVWGVKFGDGKVLVGLGGALIGAVATYLGMKLKNGNGDKP